MRQMGFLSMMHDLVVTGSQFIIATHSPIIMAYPQSWIYLLGGKKLTPVDYKDVEHLKITREFLNHPQKMLEILMDRESPRQ